MKHDPRGSVRASALADRSQEKYSRWLAKREGHKNMLFSVIIPCYNYAAFLPEAVASAAMQNFHDMEVIIINDGSPDNTAEVALKLVRDCAAPNLRYVEQTNQGLSMARNAGIALARGEWIVALDSDDMLAEGFLAAVAGHAADNPRVDAVSGAYREFGARESEWRLTRFRPERLLVQGNILCCVPYRRALWEQVGGYAPDNPWGGEDWHFWIKCLGQDFHFAAIPVPMLHYRIHENGSRAQTRAPYQDDFLAMHHSMAVEAYPRESILAAHATLERMSEATYAALLRKTAKLPHLPRPHFWLGLALEGRGNYEAARREYLIALNTPWPGSWQAADRLARLEALMHTGEDGRVTYGNTRALTKE